MALQPPNNVSGGSGSGRRRIRMPILNPSSSESSIFETVLGSNQETHSNSSNNSSNDTVLHRSPEVTPVRITPEMLSEWQISDCTEVQIGDKKICVAAKDLKFTKLLGSGQYGVVEHSVHVPSGLQFAVKRISCSTESDQFRRTLRERDIQMRSSNCPYTIQFYGAMVREGDLYICMELMDTTVHHMYMKRELSEVIIQGILYSVVSALDYLDKKLSVIHRDVKPTNILADKQGRVKVCDFGISAIMVDARANTNVGSKPYLSPERINPPRENIGYTIKSDVWSLGITGMELAQRKYPYREWTTPFEQITDVVENPAPHLSPSSGYSDNLINFLDRCLEKNPLLRANYEELLAHPFLITVNMEESRQQIASLVRDIVQEEDDRIRQHQSNYVRKL